MPTRYFIRFEKRDGLQSVIFPTHRYEYEQTQDLMMADMPLVGENYSYDQAAARPALKSNAVERVRFLHVGESEMVDQEIDAFKRMVDWGVGKIVTKGADGTERWAWGRPVEMPQINLTVENIMHFPQVAGFIRSSDFYTTEHDEEIDISSDPQTVTVENFGNATAKDVVITLKGPFTNPTVTNNSALLEDTSTPYKLETSTDAASSATWIKFDARRNEVMKSTDSGGTWVDDTANYIRQDGQVRLMIFPSGVNSLVVTGVTGDIEVEFTDSWH
jgi:hypothetical protein